jgi:hypothetical protein
MQRVAQVTNLFDRKPDTAGQLGPFVSRTPARSSQGPPRLQRGSSSSTGGRFTRQAHLWDERRYQIVAQPDRLDLEGTHVENRVMAQVDVFNATNSASILTRTSSARRPAQWNPS